MKGLLQCVVLAVAISAASTGFTQTYPTKGKPIRIVVPYAPGGVADLLSRIVGQRLGPQYGTQIVIDNRPGAGGHVGGELTAKSAPDGYTLMLGTTTHNAAYAMYSKLAYDPPKDLQPIVLLAESQGVLLVHPTLPVKTVKEFLALARSQPGQLNYASAGPGSATHLMAELLKMVGGIKLTHIAYKGSGPAMIDLVSGHVETMVENVSTAAPHVKAGKVRALGVTSRKRDHNLPDVPTIAEAGLPAYEAVPYYTMSTAAKVPQDIVRKLAVDIDAIVRHPELATRWNELGITPLGGTPEAAVKRNALETATWTKVIKTANIRAD
ncbi:MAG TPA: tripartite tricarboxylate transporter substrate binding protein [Burkholderiales bacterium]|nr:tripartite tricarboxylate transporter substrate binding protein [Burkholderiales bacterium]